MLTCPFSERFPCKVLKDFHKPQIHRLLTLDVNHAKGIILNSSHAFVLFVGTFARGCTHVHSSRNVWELLERHEAVDIFTGDVPDGVLQFGAIAGRV